MNLNNSFFFKRRNFFKFSFITLLSINFLSSVKNEKKTIVTKKIGNEYWILSSDDF